MDGINKKWETELGASGCMETVGTKLLLEGISTSLFFLADSGNRRLGSDIALQEFPSPVQLHRNTQVGMVQHRR